MFFGAYPNSALFFLFLVYRQPCSRVLYPPKLDLDLIHVALSFPFRSYSPGDLAGLQS